MLRIVLTYGALLAAGAFGLEWLQYRFLVRAYPGEVFVTLVALAFLGLGIWAGARLFTPEAVPSLATPGRSPADLGISERERQVLALLAAGQSNKEIARLLGVSPNTVKTHVARLFEKLQAKRRTQAIARARELGVLP